MPIIILVYQQADLSTSQVFLLQAAYALSVVAMELPSGRISDRFSRKFCLLIAFLFSTVGYGVYATGTGFSVWLIAEIFLGIGTAFFSGTDSAVLFESSAILKNEGEYSKWEAKSQAYANWSESLAALVCGIILPYVSFFGLYWIQTSLFCIACITIAFIHEPKHKIHQEKHQFFRSSIAVLKEFPLVQSPFFMSVLFGFSTLFLAWSVQ